MGIFPTFYAHWRLNAMLRAWRRANKLLDGMSGFLSKHCSESELKEFTEAFKSMENAFDKVTSKVEDRIITELKERV